MWVTATSSWAACSAACPSSTAAVCHKPACAVRLAIVAPRCLLHALKQPHCRYLHLCCHRPVRMWVNATTWLTCGAACPCGTAAWWYKPVCAARLSTVARRGLLHAPKQPHIIDMQRCCHRPVRIWVNATSCWTCGAACPCGTAAWWYKPVCAARLSTVARRGLLHAPKQPHSRYMQLCCHRHVRMWVNATTWLTCGAACPCGTAAW
jgi:hypothetical protein